MIPLRYLASLILFFGIIAHSSAQKTKYKDIFPLLSAQDYDQGGPLLIQYLSDPKNATEANPNLQMGLMLAHQFEGLDVVHDSLRMKTAGDSAVLFLNKAISLITEKELKKREEYYQPFFRRDLRTGDFGIKISDVHLDIEKKVERIKFRIAEAKSLNNALRRCNQKEKSAIDRYHALSASYGSFNEMLLSASEKDTKEVEAIRALIRSAKSEAEKAKTHAKNLETDRYQSETVLMPLAGFDEVELSAHDLWQGAISLWDFDSWGEKYIAEQQGDVKALKAEISEYTDELRAKKARLSNSEAVTGLEVPRHLISLLEKYREAAVVNTLLKSETYEARVMQQVDLQINPDLMDSSKIGAQLQIYAKALANADSLASLIETVAMEDLLGMKKMFRDYSDSFFKKYVTASKYVEQMKDWSVQNKNWLASAVKYWEEKNQWGIIAKEGEEEIQVRLAPQKGPENGFKTLDVLHASIEEVIVCGIDTRGQKGYVKAFGGDRYETWTVEFPLPGDTLSYQYAYDSLPTAEGHTSFYVYNAMADSANFSAVSFNPSQHTLKWAVNISLPKEPIEFNFDALTQELTILMYPEEELPLDSDELGYVVIDRTGHAR